jgi:RNA polymerase sigma-70 factor (ECF subfamily)
MTEPSCDKSRPEPGEPPPLAVAAANQAATDEELMLAIAAGQSGCWPLLVGRYEKRVYNYLLRSTRDPATAEDLLQSTFMRVFEARARYQPSARFATWIYTIATNLLRDELRRQGRWQIADEVEPEQDLPDPHGPEQQAEHGEVRDRVMRAIGELPDGMRQALILGKYEGRSYAEIAGILGCSVTAATVRVHRALGLLRQRLGVDHAM